MSHDDNHVNGCLTFWAIITFKICLRFNLDFKTQRSIHSQITNVNKPYRSLFKLRKKRTRYLDLTNFEKIFFRSFRCRRVGNVKQIQTSKCFSILDSTSSSKSNRQQWFADSVTCFPEEFAIRSEQIKEKIKIYLWNFCLAINELSNKFPFNIFLMNNIDRNDENISSHWTRWSKNLVVLTVRHVDR